MKRLVLCAPGIALLLAACSPPAAKALDAPAPKPSAPAVMATDAPPTVGGLYVAKGSCPGEGCYLQGRIRAYEPADLFDKAGAGAAVIGKVAAGEWVEITSREEHLVPLRGVVRNSARHFAAGDIVYLLSSQGEGCYSTWSKGVIGSWCDPEAAGDSAIDEAIDLDALASPPEGAGLWVEIKRSAGAGGWLHDVRSFACTGYQDRDADCPPLPQ